MKATTKVDPKVVDGFRRILLEDGGLIVRYVLLAPRAHDNEGCFSPALRAEVLNAYKPEKGKPSISRLHMTVRVGADGLTYDLGILSCLCHFSRELERVLGRWQELAKEKENNKFFRSFMEPKKFVGVSFARDGKTKMLDQANPNLLFFHGVIAQKLWSYHEKMSSMYEDLDWGDELGEMEKACRKLAEDFSEFAALALTKNWKQGLSSMRRLSKVKT